MLYTFYLLIYLILVKEKEEKDEEKKESNRVERGSKLMKLVYDKLSCTCI